MCYKDEYRSKHTRNCNLSFDLQSGNMLFRECISSLLRSKIKPDGEMRVLPRTGSRNQQVLGVFAFVVCDNVHEIQNYMLQLCFEAS